MMAPSGSCWSLFSSSSGTFQLIPGERFVFGCCRCQCLCSSAKYTRALYQPSWKWGSPLWLVRTEGIRNYQPSAGHLKRWQSLLLMYGAPNKHLPITDNSQEELGIFYLPKYRSRLRLNCLLITPRDKQMYHCEHRMCRSGFSPCLASGGKMGMGLW